MKARDSAMDAQREAEILSEKYSHSQNVRYRVVPKPLFRCNIVVSMMWNLFKIYH